MLNILQIAYSIFSDIVCTLLPVFILWNVQISLRLKFAVWGLMSLGLLATICAAVRASLSGNDTDTDLTYSLAFISIWASLEMNYGVTAANLALSRYMWIFFFGEPYHSKGTQALNRKHYYALNSGRATTTFTGRRLALDRTSQTDDIHLEPVSHESEVRVGRASRSDSLSEPEDGIRRVTDIQVTGL